MARTSNEKRRARKERSEERRAQKRAEKREKRVSKKGGWLRRHRPHPIQVIRRHKQTISRVLLVLLVLFVCAVPVPFIDNAIGYIPLIAVVCLIIVSFVYLQILKRSFSYSEDSLLPSCERGSDIEFVVNFKNSSPLVFTRLEATFYISDLFGDVDVSIPASLPLMPFEKRDFEFAATFEHIGAYNAGVEKIVIGDLLGLFSYTIVNDKRHSVRVLPKLFDISNIDLENVSIQQTQTSARPIITDDMDYAGVREYAIGDPLKNIHWNLSARNPSGEYYTRLFEIFGNPGVAIIMDTSAPEYTHEGLMQVFDGVVESALSMATYSHGRGMDTELVYLDKSGERVKTIFVGAEDSDELVDSIPRIKVGDSYGGADLLKREGTSLFAKGNIVYCTSHLDDLVISTLIEIQNQRHSPLLYLVVPTELEGVERKEYLRALHRLEDAQIPAFVISSAKDIAEGEAA